MSDFWGYHAIFDCANCDTKLVTNGEHIKKFVKTLVKEIDMKAYGEPTVVHFAEHDKDKAGYSLVQLIETSAITGHFVDKNGDCYLDIFSCKPYDLDTCIKVINKFFNPKTVRTTFLNRQA